VLVWHFLLRNKGIQVTKKHIWGRQGNARRESGHVSCWMILHTLKKGLCRLREDNFIICFHNNWLFGWLRSGFFFRIQLKLMKQIQALLTDITVEIKGYSYFKLSPSRFRQLEGWLLYNSCRVLETWVKLKHHMLNYDTQVLIVCRTDINSPLVRVVPKIEWMHTHGH